MLGPLLERLAQEAQGAFRLAKLDVDANPNLAMRYNVSGIPAVKAFRNGQVVAEFVGAQPEPVVRKFLRELAPSQSDLKIEKGKSMLLAGEWAEAEAAFREVLDGHDENPAALLGLSKSLLAQGFASESLNLLKHFPASKEYYTAEKLRALAQALDWLETSDIGDDDDLLAAAYRRALTLVKRNLPAAMDGLLEVLRADKRYRDDQARKVMLGLLEVLGEQDPLYRQYHQELASVLF
jgi:putative thioredoxin